MYIVYRFVVTVHSYTATSNEVVLYLLTLNSAQTLTGLELIDIEATSE